MTVSELLNRISSREISEWMAFGQLEPFGAEIEFIGHAITATTIANVNREKGKKAYDVSDFMPEFGTKEPQSVEEAIQFAVMYTAAMGGKDLREEK